MTGKRRQDSPSVSDSLEKLLIKKAKMVENIIRIRQSIRDKTISYNPIELQCRLDILEQYIGQAMKLQSDVENINPENSDRAEMEEVFVTTKSLFLSILAKNKQHPTPEKLCTAQSHQIRLPNMKLPKFTGKYSEYKNFMSLFESLIHNETTLTDIEKFNHLISCLSESALGTVKAFQISEENYPKALASLKKVYDNECLIFFDNIAKLFDLPQIIKPSASALRSMIDTVSAIYDSLLSIGDDKNITNAILIHLVMSKVDSVTKSKWEEQLNFEKLPLWSDCEAALNKRYQHISADESAISRPTFIKSKTNYSTHKNSRTSLNCAKSKQAVEKCLFCKSNQHDIKNCPSFAAESVIKRFEFVKAVPACINCLRKGHTVARCSSPKCKICSGSHNELLHRYNTESSNLLSNYSHQPPTFQASVNYSSSVERIVLATAIVQVRNSYGQFISARALLDSGSQPNLMTEELAQLLRLKRERGRLSLTGISETTSFAKSSVNLTVKSRINATQFTSKFWVLSSITNLQPDRGINATKLNIPRNVELADPCFQKPQKIDLLIGAENFFDLLCVGQIKLGRNLPIVQKTVLGWVVTGKYKQSTGSRNSKVFHLSSSIENENNIDSIVKKFWELEELPNQSTKIWSEEHQQCEDQFKNSARRLPSGRFEVSLPFKSDTKLLGSYFETAKRRFLSLEGKLSKDRVMRQMYHDFMKEYLELGHMSLLDHMPDLPHYFIPQQCVLRPQSKTTKLRVVFDASCKTTSHVSLNDLLMVGPTLQEELYSTLIRFRFHKYAMTADIEKMYRQVLVAENDRKYQLILWRENPLDALKVFRLNTVTYGTASAPYLAIRCLIQLSDLYKETLAIGSKVVHSDFYVDDLLTGAESVDDLNTNCNQVTEILCSAGFKLTKWMSNHSEFVNTVFNEKLLHSDSESTKALGIHWVPKNDSFQFYFGDNLQDIKPTKRNILSVSSRLFYPLGLLCPVVTKAKILLQELWIQNLDWDESIPMALNTSWENFKSNLLQIDSIKVPRFVHTTSTASIQIHGFADASIRAYGCCIYIRSYEYNKTVSRLLTTKSKVAPLKSKSLPRLELCAAHLLAKLWNRIKLMISFKIESVNFWTDSEITLHWIKTHPFSLLTFISNRVAEIQEWSNQVSWRHVPTKQNPADIVSRGCDVNELNTSMWFKGPSVLLNDSSEWPVNDHIELTENQKLLEKRKLNVFLAVEDPQNILLGLIEKYSSYKKLLRITSLVFRFVDVLKKRKIFKNSVPTAIELKWSFYRFIETIQKSYFAEEISKLQKSLTLPSNIQRLTPFLHSFTEENRIFSLIRVGGRLLNAKLKYNTKFPLLLPKRNKFVTLYLQNLHFENCHAGTKALIALSRISIWLINAKEECSRIVRKCVHCFRYKPKLMSQIMGNLPNNRVRVARPFLTVGVDFCGPVNISLRIRGRPPLKIYIAVLVCFTSKAVHLELVSDLSTDSFLLSFKRFAARRGVPKEVFCDNATNFVGANRILKEMQQAFERSRQAVELYAASSGVRFNFIPPRAPHFGGLWEAAVKQAKFLLLRAVGNASLTQEEMVTMLTEVEAVLNSRPIAPLSPDPNDGEALTPAHLLIGSDLRSPPPESAEDVSDRDVKLWRRWRLLCAIKRNFWQAWSRDYILGLQARNKWAKNAPNLEVGQIVIIHEEACPPQHWLTGRVVGVVAGEDGKVRVAVVKTKNGVLKRPIYKLAPLPMDWRLPVLQRGRNVKP